MSYEAFADYYDILTENIDYNAVCDYYDGLYLKYGGKRGIMLDAACGTGNLSVLLAKKGYDVIGADISADMLSAASSKPHEGVAYLCQSLTELDLYGTIQGAVCSLDGINHLSGSGDVLRAFKNIALFSEKDALFMFDVNTPYKHEKILADNTFVYETEKVYCVWQNEYRGGGVTDIRLDFFEERDGVYLRSCDEFTETAYPREKIEEMLVSSGFEVCACYEYLTENEPADTAEKLTFVARKKYDQTREI